MAIDDLPKLHPSVLVQYARIAERLANAYADLQMMVGAHMAAQFMIDMGQRLKAEADAELAKQNWGHGPVGNKPE